MHAISKILSAIIVLEIFCKQFRLKYIKKVDRFAPIAKNRFLQRFDPNRSSFRRVEILVLFFWSNHDQK